MYEINNTTKKTVIITRKTSLLMRYDQIFIPTKYGVKTYITNIENKLYILVRLAKVIFDKKNLKSNPMKIQKYIFIDAKINFSINKYVL